MDSTSLHRFLAEGGWQSQFKHSTLQHGAAYVREQRVSSLNHATLDPHTESLTGAVSGHRSQPYLCALELRTLRSGTQIRSQCSCNEDSPCKHAAAILIVAGLSAPEIWPGIAGARPQPRHRSKGQIKIRKNSDRYIETSPLPVLVFRSVAAQEGASERYACARLEFDYDGHRVGAAQDNNTTLMSRDAEAIEIRRDLTSEAIAKERIEGCGFVHAGFIPARPGEPLTQSNNQDYLLRPNKRKPALCPEDCATQIAALEQDGFKVEYDYDFPRHELVEVDDWHATLSHSDNAWFDVALGVDIDGKHVDILPVLRQVLDDPAFSLTAQSDENPHATRRIRLNAKHSIELSTAQLRELVSPLVEWLQSGDSDAGMRVHVSQASALQEITTQSGLVWHGAEVLRSKLAQLADTPRWLDTPKGFRGELRAYQHEGLAWLHFLAQTGIGGILADDMGLGKTVQVLAHIVDEKHRGNLANPVLIIAPTSLIGNWRDEAARFVPELKLLVLHGSNRRKRYADIPDHDLIVTTYPLLPRDRCLLAEQKFSLLVLDEAQAIKNSRSQAARVVRTIKAQRRLAMTGTPLENHLGELWSQFDAVEPGLLGNERQFAKFYRKPIEKQDDKVQRERLKKRIAPLLLRRRKDDVLTELPAKTEIIRTLELNRDQRRLYESLRLTQHDRVRQAIRQRGLARSGIVVLDALLKLRQVCCDPRLVKLESAHKVHGSAKLDALLELLEGLRDEDRRVLVFSQFTQMLALIEAQLKRLDIPHLVLTGQTPGGARADLIGQFQSGNVPVFLVSLKAGGVGLNLTAADAVIHYDPWWNPAVENQATDRAHRIGQDKPVFVYKLLCSGTVEEKIHALQARKAKLAQALLDGDGSGRLHFDEEDLAELFEPLS